MNYPLPPEIRVTDHRDGPGYQFPVSLALGGALRQTGMVMLTMFGAIWGVFVAAIAYNNAPGVVSQTLVGLLTFAAAMVITAMRIMVRTWGQPELSVRRGELLLRRRMFTLSHTKRAKLADLTSLYVTMEGPRAKALVPSVAAALSGQLRGLGYTTAAGERTQFLQGFPDAWMQAVAERLSADAGRAEAGGAGHPLPVGHIDYFTSEWLNLTDPLGPRPGAMVQLKRVAGGIVAVLPSQGYRPGSPAYISVSMGWVLLAVGVIGTAVFGFSGIKFQGNTDPRGLLVMTIPAVFGGVFLLRQARQLAQRRTSLRVSPQEFITVEHSSAGETTSRLDPSAITAIEVAVTGTLLDQRRVRELRVSLRTGGTQTLGPDIPDAELDWFAAVLRDVLNLPHQPSLWPVPPVTTQIRSGSSRRSWDSHFN
jgi:hypothetical protein